MHEKVCILVPVYNEDKKIMSVINDLQKYFKNILVVNDGSNDNTGAILKLCNVHTLNHLINLGAGAAIFSGFEYIKTMENIDMLLREAGSCMEQVCRIVVYLTDIRYREEVYHEMGVWLKGVFPCSTGIVVPALARPEWVVEIEVTAVIPD